MKLIINYYLALYKHVHRAPQHRIINDPAEIYKVLLRDVCDVKSRGWRKLKRHTQVTVTAHVGGKKMEHGLLYCSKEIGNPAEYYYLLWNYTSSSGNMSHGYVYVPQHTYYTHVNVNTRIEVVHANLLCGCCCAVAATKQRAWELEARCDTDDMIRQQQQQAEQKTDWNGVPAHIHGPALTYAHAPYHTQHIHAYAMFTHA